MSKENAELFLKAVAQDSTLRDKLTAITSLNEFVEVAESMGYNFTDHEFKVVIKENSEGINMRRKTGIWPWLRHFNWL